VQKRVSLLAMFALAVLLFLIWTDPSGTAHVISNFFGAIGDFGRELGHRVAEFFRGLGWS